MQPLKSLHSFERICLTYHVEFSLTYIFKLYRVPSLVKVASFQVTRLLVTLLSQDILQLVWDSLALLPIMIYIQLRILHSLYMILRYKSSI